MENNSYAEIEEEANAYLAGCAARGFVPEPATIERYKSRLLRAKKQLEVLEELGYEIKEDSDQLGLWVWTAPTDACESSFDSAQEALGAAWSDAASQAMAIENTSSEEWDALSLEQQAQRILSVLSSDYDSPRP